MPKTHIVAEVSLKPYRVGRLYATRSKRGYIKAVHRYIAKDFLKANPPDIDTNTGGQTFAGPDKKGNSVYVVWLGASKDIATHELTHVALDVFETVDIDPRDAGGEPFCYFLQYLINETNKALAPRKRKRPCQTSPSAKQTTAPSHRNASARPPPRTHTGSLTQPSLQRSHNTKKRLQPQPARDLSPPTTQPPNRYGRTQRQNQSRDAERDGA